MKKTIFAAILFVSLLAGCANKDTLEPQPLNPSAPTEEAPAFEKGVFVDFTKLSDEFITDEIVQTLKSNLEALVNKEVDKFKADLLEGHDTIGNMDYVQNANQYKFIEVSGSEYFTAKKTVMISLSVQIWRDANHIDNSGITYYFQTDKTGKWKIALID